MSSGTEPASVTRREAEVLALLADQLTNAEIAERLFVSVRTVESHVSALLTKLAAANRRELGRIGASRRPPSLSRPTVPRPATRFVGRADELVELDRMLDAERIVTLVGPPGVGKTRLAIELAQPSRGAPQPPPCMIDLAALPPAASVITIGDTVAQTLGIAPRAGQSSLDAIAAASPAPGLMLLDNCEHVLAGSAAIAAELVAGSEAIHILATSREPLGIAGEAIFEVEPLPVPDAGDGGAVADLASIPAVDLFVDRATAASREFELTATNASAVATLCRRLDGLPLAIELAAARVRTFPTNELVAHLDQRFELLGRGAPNPERRYRTLREAIEWSYDSLDSDERDLFDRLGVFPADFDFAAAAAVAAPATLDAVRLLPSLVDKSLVVASGGESARRYRMLESLRDFAAERLRQRGASEQARAAHRDWYLELSRDILARYRERGQAGMLARFDLEHENLGAALGWCRQQGDAIAGLRLAAALWRYWDVRGRFAEGLGWLDEFIDVVPDAPAEVRADAYRAYEVLATGAGDYAAAAGAARQFLVLARSMGDDRRLGQALNGWGTSCWRRGDVDAAIAAWREQLALCRTSDQPIGVAVVLNNLAVVAREQGRYDEATAMLADSLAIARDVGGWGDYTAIAIFNLGQVDAVRGELARGADALVRALELWEASGNLHGIAKATTVAASIEVARGRHGAANALLERSIAVATETGDRQRLAFARCGRGDVARLGGRCGEAAEHYGAALALFRTLGEPLGIAAALAGRAGADLARGDSDTAQARASEALELYRSLGHRRGVAATHSLLAAVARNEGDHGRSGELLRAALADFVALGCRADLAPCLEDLAEHELDEQDERAAAKLLATAAAARDALGTPVPPCRRRRLEQLRSRLGPARVTPAAESIAVDEPVNVDELVQRALSAWVS